MTRRRSVLRSGGLPQDEHVHNPVEEGVDWRTEPETGNEKPPGDSGTETPKPAVTYRTAAVDATIQSSAAEGPVNFAFGLQESAGKVQFIKQLQQLSPYLYYTAEVWLVIEHCIGEIDAMLEMWIDDKQLGDFPSSAIQAWHHLGTTTQPVDPNFKAVYPAWNEDFIVRDAGGNPLFGVANTIVRLVDIARNFPAMPKFRFVYRAMKCLDPRTGTRIYSTNPWSQWNEWARHPAGRNLPASRINSTKIIAACDVADEVMGDGSKRYESHLRMATESAPEEWEKIFRLLADGYIPFTSNEYHPFSDRPAAVVASYDDTVLVEAEPPAGRADSSERPNHIVVRFTEVTTAGGITTWDDQAFEEAKTAALIAGTEPARKAEYLLPWVHDRGRARRLAIYLANDHLFDFEMRPLWFPDAANRVIGELVEQSVTAYGIAAQAFRIFDVERLPDGKTRPLLREYDPARYSDQVVAAGSKIASTLPGPHDLPPPPTNLTAELETYNGPNGVAVRIRVAWDPVDHLYFDAFEIEYDVDGGEVVELPDAQRGPVMIAPVTVGKTYNITVRTRSTYGKLSTDVVIAKVVPNDPPSDVAVLVGGISETSVVLHWGHATDVDLAGYIVRRGKPGAPWEQMQELGRTNDLTWTDRPPRGLHLYGVKAVDSVENESANMKTLEVDAPGVAQLDETWFIRPNPLDSPPGTNNSEMKFYVRDSDTGEWSYTSYALGATHIYGSLKYFHRFNSAPAQQLDDINDASVIVEGSTGTFQAPFVPPLLLHDNIAVRGAEQIFLCRGWSFADFDAEITNAGLSNVQEWIDQIDDPRRTKNGVVQPIIFPLMHHLWAAGDPNPMKWQPKVIRTGPIIFNGSHGGTSRRNLRYNISAPQTRIVGDITPLTRAAIRYLMAQREELQYHADGGAGDLFWGEEHTTPEIGPYYLDPLSGARLAATWSPGFGLFTNSLFATPVVEAESGGAMLHVDQARIVKPLPPGTLTLTTQVSGSNLFTFPTPLPAGTLPSVRLTLLSATLYHIALESVSNADFWLKAWDAAGSPVGGVSVRCDLADTGLGGTDLEFNAEWEAA